MRRKWPADFARAVAVDEAIRDGSARGGEFPAFLHRRRLPLASLDFERMLAEDRAQGRLFPRGGEGNECAGVCFV